MHEGHSFLSKNPCKKPISFANWLVRQLSGRPVLTNGKGPRWWRSLFRYAALIAKMRAYNLNQTNWATWLFTRWMRSELYRVNPQCIEIILTNFGICLFKRDVNAVFNNKFKKKHVGYPTLNYDQIIIIIKTQSSVYIHIVLFKNGIIFWKRKKE